MTFTRPRAAVLSVALAVVMLLAKPLPVTAQSDGVPGNPGIIVRPWELELELLEEADIKISPGLGHRVEVRRFQGRGTRVFAAGSEEG